MEKEVPQHPLIADSIDQLIGNTPMIKLNKVTDGCVATIVCKLESHEPCSSVKDRLALSMINEAEKRGTIKPGDTLVEPTSGNTGIAIAMIAAARGYKFVCVMPDTMSMERRVMVKSFGAELILTPGAKSVPGAIAMAEKIVQERGAIMLQQFANPDNALIHRETTGPEIWKQTEGKVDIFVAGVGTGGTITGCTEYLKSLKPTIQSVAVEPEESQVMAGKPKGPHKIQGIGAGFIPSVMDMKIIDDIIPVSTVDAIAMARRLALEEGIMVGFSSGAAVEAAVRLAKKPENEGKLIVTVLPSFGERYLSTVLFADVMQECKDMPTQDV